MASQFLKKSLLEYNQPLPEEWLISRADIPFPPKTIYESKM